MRSLAAGNAEVGVARVETVAMCHVERGNGSVGWSVGFMSWECDIGSWMRLIDRVRSGCALL